MASFGYYTNHEPHKLITLFKNRKLAIIIAALGFALILILFSNKGIIQRIKLESQKKVLIDRMRALELENERLRLEEKNLTSDLSTIEHVAREKHGMIKKGEIVFRIREIQK